MQQQAPRKYQRNAIRGKGLSIWLSPALRAKVQEAAEAGNTSLSAIIVSVLKSYFGLSDEDQERAA